jgi:hypothetical protein
MTHTIGTFGAIRVPNEENRDLLVNAAVVNRLASEATTDIVLDESQNIRRTFPTDIDLSQIVNNNAPITIPDEKIIREITQSLNTLELQLKDFLIMELSIIKGNIDIAASEKPYINFCFKSLTISGFSDAAILYSLLLLIIPLLKNLLIVALKCLMIV